MTDTSNRTFVCSVLFLDIVEYSTKPVSEQLSLKQRFNALLLDAMRHVAAADRIVLDTGDGAAVSFLGNPEDCVFAAMALRDAIAAESPELQPPMRVRIGINLGPVRLLKDINGQLNIIGDGINVAQRIMSFAEPGAILVSRSYYDVVSCLSGDLSRLFEYNGTRTDKHVREHAVYSIGAGIPSIARPSGSGASASPPGDAATAAPAAALPAAPPSTAPSSATPNRKRLWAAVAAAALLVGGAFLVRLERAPQALPQQADADAGQAQVALPSDAAKPSEPTKVFVSLAVFPWGEVFVDDRNMGVSPPLKNLTLPPGPHRIEVRNTTFPPYVQTIDGVAGRKIKIRHKFQ